MLSLIYASTANGLIGDQWKLPWHLPDDLKAFRDKTKGHVVLMGRKTYESLPEAFKPLPDRINVVLTRDTSLKLESAIIVHSIEEAIELFKDKKIWVIGGAEIYKLAMPYVKEVHHTLVLKDFKGDTYFDFDYIGEWNIISLSMLCMDSKTGIPFSTIVYQRN